MPDPTDTPAPIGLALLGVGTVGGGVLSLVRDGGDALAGRTGLRFDVRHAVARDPSKYADLAASGVDVTTDAEAAVDDPAVKIVVELIGGVDRAGDLVRRALTLGKPVVTANKSLLATHGAELFALARKNGTCVAFEASCAGGLPVVNAISTGLVANRVDALVGILNGTTNVILTRMGADGLTYAAALKEAQDAGFAEADPTMDVSGRDAAQKLAILASIAFGRRVVEGQVHVEGVEAIDPVDLAFARSLGYAVKLLAIASREPSTPAAHGRPGHGERLSLRVHPALVPRADVLADVSGPFNAVGVYGDAAGHALFYGRGAGRGPTASAVVADLVSVATGAWPAAFAAMRTLPDLTRPRRRPAVRRGARPALPAPRRPRRAGRDGRRRRRPRSPRHRAERDPPEGGRERRGVRPDRHHDPPREGGRRADRDGRDRRPADRPPPDRPPAHSRRPPRVRRGVTPPAGA